MSAAPETAKQPEAESSADPAVGQLQQGTYEIIRNRLRDGSAELRTRLEKLNAERQQVFGSIPTELLATDRISTTNNCVPRDFVSIGDLFIVGFNVHIGLKSETDLKDVFAIYRFEEQAFHSQPLDVLHDPNFEHDFRQLYKYYKDTRFSKFQVIGPNLYMVFQVGATSSDVKSLKWQIQDGQLIYLDNRSDHEVRFPAQHEFDWVRTHRDLHRSGAHPHISVNDRVFVETIGGDLTIKVEDNTDDGHGIYREPVEDPDQTLDDAEIFYAIVGNIILLKVRPFKEEQFRYLVFNEKIQSAMRLDALQNACVLLPEDHGLIFSNGYYLQTGEHKTFDTQQTELLFERMIPSPNGEDYLYVFYNVVSGTYVLLSYNMILQQVSTPIVCHGFSIFENGNLIYFKSDGSPQKHHAIQIWQTPYVCQDQAVHEESDSFLFKIGNRDIVRGMSECHEIISLIGQDESYADLYSDLVRKSGDVIDSYFWISSPETFDLAEVLSQIKETAEAAVDEYEKVVRIRQNTNRQTSQTFNEAKTVLGEASRRMYRSIDDFVETLAGFRSVRGKVISLKDLKYADIAAIDELEQKIIEETDACSKKCVQFLIRDDSLAPYVERVEATKSQIDDLQTAAQARELDEAIVEESGHLEMLIEIVSNLKIDDATQRTQIIDDISAIYSNLNQTRARLKKKNKELMSVEGAAEFSSQIKLLAQAVVNYIDVCDTPQKCDEFLTKLMVQVEELEGRFAEFDEYIVQLAEKREEIYSAFDARKLQIVEARNRRAASLVSAAERILKGIDTRISNLESVDEINSYFASDMMIEKVRDIVDQLMELEETVKVDDIQSRLKTIREDAVRQLHDKQELFVDGQNVIQLGRHKFTVNTQPLELTTVVKDDEMFFHLTGTNYSEKIVDDDLNSLVSYWDQHLLSEDREVYRSEYLAFQAFLKAETGEFEDPEQLVKHDEKQMTALMQKFMSARYSEGYVKGVHDHDAGIILQELIRLKHQLGLLKYRARARALANVFWCAADKAEYYDPPIKGLLEPKIRSIGQAGQLFNDPESRAEVVEEIIADIGQFQEAYNIATADDVPAAAEFLFDEVSSGSIAAGKDVVDLVTEFDLTLSRKRLKEDFESACSQLPPLDRWELARQWLSGFARQGSERMSPGMLDEAAALLLILSDSNASISTVQPLEGDSERHITNLLGDHPRIANGRYDLDFSEFMTRLRRFEDITTKDFLRLADVKKELLENRRHDLRLDEFKPRVLTSFVRNKLINDVYLPMIGDNLAKQIGAAGDEKRTDLMGLLLLVSPPGYGKTTLMEYIANRLGLIFMKINGPAIGHQVTSLDPNEAPNASAREEVEKLNLALEMGDNVMIYVDDIQHCNPEFLQKFISLCDATRRIEGVFQGRTRTYDLRGRKVCVVMAGNPYTESGEKFRIPDMLANRADTYNLGDVIGDNEETFELSYLENCLTSNSVLAQLHTRSREDVYNVIKIAGREDPAGQLTLEGNFSVEEIREFVEVMEKLLRIRDVVLQVNQQYITSAAQQDDYRTEPAFKLQGSYRDMNKMAERVMSIMNEDELRTLIYSHYENQAQTLTSGAEANLLKFKELAGTMSTEEKKRWNEIKGTFKRNLLLGSVQGDDQLSQIIAQMTTFSQGLIDIKTSLDDAAEKLTEQPEEEPEESLQTATIAQISHAVSELSRFNETMSDIKGLIGDSVAARQQEVEAAAAAASEVDEPMEELPKQKIEIVNKVPQSLANIIHSQFRILQTWMEPILKLCEALPEAENLKKSAKLTKRQYKKMLDKIEFTGDEPKQEEEE